jgi:hypothetical protein
VAGLTLLDLFGGLSDFPLDECLTLGDHLLVGFNICNVFGFHIAGLLG